MATDTRDRIVHTAMRLFAEKGYGSTSVADLLSAAEVNSGSLYYFFPGKQDVLTGVLDAYHEGIEPMLLAPAWRKIDDPIERVFALLASYRKRLKATDCSYACPIGSIALELHEPDPQVRERLSANFEAWIDAVDRCYAAAAARLPADVNTHALAVFTLTTMEGGVMLARTFRDLAPFDAAVQALRSYLDLLQHPAAARADEPRTRKPRPRRRTQDPSHTKD